MFNPFRRRSSSSFERGPQDDVDRESWSDKDAKVEVTRPEGFLMKVEALSSNRSKEAAVCQISWGTCYNGEAVLP